MYTANESVVAHVLQPCQGKQGNQATITINTDNKILMITTPQGFSCVTNDCRDVSTTTIDQCEYNVLITVRVINCTSNFSGKHAWNWCNFSEF